MKFIITKIEVILKFHALCELRNPMNIMCNNYEYQEYKT
jgi:hypothetical protein